MRRLSRTEEGREGAQRRRWAEGAWPEVGSDRAGFGVSQVSVQGCEQSRDVIGPKGKGGGQTARQGGHGPAQSGGTEGRRG